MSDTRRKRRAGWLLYLRRAAASLGSLLVVGFGCARFGYEFLEPLQDPGVGGAPSATGVAGAAVGGSGGSPEVGGTGGAVAGASGMGGNGVAGEGQVALGSCSDGLQRGDEAGVDCGGTRCAPCACTLGEPEALADPNFAGNDLWSPSISSDGTRLYFALTVPGFVERIAVASRADRGSAFGLGQPLPAPVNQQTNNGTPRLSVDGLSLYFFSERSGGVGGRDLYVASRRNLGDDFAQVRALTSLNGPDREHLPWISADERTIYFVSNRTGIADIFRATRGAVQADFDAPEAVTELNSDGEDGGVTLTSDGLEIILASNRAGSRDLYRATRASELDAFSPPELIEALNSSNNDFDPALSPDNRELYFVSNRGGGETWIYRSLRTCTR